MTREEIVARLRVELAQGVTFERSTYNLAPEWQRKAFDYSMRNVVRETEVHVRWHMFRQGIRAACDRMGSVIMGEQG